MAGERAGDAVTREAMVLTEEEWKALRGIVAFYLHEQRNTFPDRVALAHRIMAATA
jgi:hypothetical protein